MNEIERYEGQVIDRRPDNSDNAPPAPEPEGEGAVEVMAGILRQWRTALVVFIVVCVLGVPAIWLLMASPYSVAGAIRVVPIMPDILTGKEDSGVISNYQQFMNTQVAMMTSSQVIQRVADDLAGRNLNFFENVSTNLTAKLDRTFSKARAKPDLASVLKQAIFDNIISVQTVTQTELIKITMLYKDPEEAKQIVDALIRAYMANESSAGSKDQEQQLRVLEDEQKVQLDKLERQRAQVRQLAQEYGTTTLGDRQNMMLSRVTDILSELTKAETRRANIENQLQSFEQSTTAPASPEESLKVRNDYINADPTVKGLTQQVSSLDIELARHKQMYVTDNPDLVQEQEFLNLVKGSLEERRQELSKNFDKAMSEEITRTRAEKLSNAKIELAQAIAYENRLREKLAKEDTETIEIGRRQLSIQDVQEQMVMTKAMYDRIRERIQQLEMERKRPARVSVAYNADIEPTGDKRMKGTLGLVFGAMACGMLLAFLRDKADHSVRTADQVVKQIGIRVIGTTTRMDAAQRTLLPEMMVQDFNTIRANLGLIDGEGVPQKLVVASPGMSDGKTTFAINLATSMAQSGKKVLLIDGDLRKPDIARLLDLPKGARGLQEMVAGGDIAQAVYTVASSGMDVLAADSSNAENAYEFLTLLFASECMKALGQKYDHIIIDTPPVLAFPDALLCAKMADAVILTSLAGKTSSPDLNEVKKRLAQIGAKVLGAVLGNVSVGSGYYRYGYGYYSSDGHRKKTRKRFDRDTFLLPPQHGHNDTHGSSDAGAS
jgi:capsular exopolysaccharide synthesis family protein